MTKATAVALVTAAISGIGSTATWEHYSGHPREDTERFLRVENQITALYTRIEQDEREPPNPSQFQDLAQRVAGIDEHGSRAIQGIVFRQDALTSQITQVSARLDTMCEKLDGLRLDVARIKQALEPRGKE